MSMNVHVLFRDGLNNEYHTSKTKNSGQMFRFQMGQQVKRTEVWKTNVLSKFRSKAFPDSIIGSTFVNLL